MAKLPRSLTAIQDKARIKHVPKGQILLYEDDQPRDVYIIKTGVIKIYNIDFEGNEKILHLVGEQALVPLSFYSGGTQKTRWFYNTLTDCDVWVIPQEQLQKAVLNDTELAKYFMNNFSVDIHELLVRLESLNKSNVHDKLVAALKFLAVAHSRKRRSGWYRVLFPVNHKFLSDLIGMTRESTSMAMKTLVDEGIIRNPRTTILEIDLKKLDSES